MIVLRKIAPSAEHLSPSNFPKQITKDGKAFFYVEAYPLLIGDTVKSLAADMSMKAAMSYSVKKAHERFPTDNITVSVHSELPNTVTIGTVSRPMSVLEADGETFIASAATAFPEDIEGKVTHLPQCSVSQENTRLERALKKHYLDGKAIYMPHGFFF